MAQPSPDKRFSLVADLYSRDGGVTKDARMHNAYTDEGLAWQRPGLGTSSGFIISTGTTGYFGSRGAGLITLDYTPIDANPIPSSVIAGVGQGTAGGRLFKIDPPILPGSDTGWSRWDGIITGGAPALGVDDGSLANCLANYAPIQWGPSIRACISLQGGKYYVRGPTAVATGSAAETLGMISTAPYQVARGTYAGGVPQPIYTNLGAVTLQYGEQMSFAVSKGGVTFIRVAQASYTLSTDGTLTAIADPDFPALTVPGVVYLDGTFYVMEPDGTIWNSVATGDDPTDWPTDGFISAEFEPDGGVCLSKALNYVVAFGKWSTEMFWDAGNATGSPLLPVNNGVLLIGCASAGSVSQTESTLIWIAQRKGQNSSAQKGRFIAILVGTSYEEVSTPSVCRILDADDLSLVYACVVEIGGHSWYILSLSTTGVTLVFDLKEKKWYTWSRLAAASPVTISRLSQVNGFVTGTATSHGLSDGDPVVIGGTSAGFTGTFNVNVTNANVFTYPISTTGTSTGTGALTATGFTEGIFDAVAAVGVNGLQLVQDQSGNVFTMNLTSPADLGSLPVNVKLRTNNMDWGNADRKFCFAVAVVGDILASAAYGLLRYTDDDFQTYSSYRRFDLSQQAQHESRWGAFRRRAWEWRHTGTSQYRIKALDPDITQGVT